MEIISGLIRPYIFVGDEGAFIEGVKKVIKWQEDCIEIFSGGSISIEGEKLKIEYKSMDTILVNGKIKSISFSKKR